MKIQINKTNLSNALAKLQGVVSARSTLAILSNVLIRAGDGTVELTTTDLDLAISCVVEADVMEQGAVTLPIKRLLPIVKESPGDNLELEVDAKNVASIRAGSSFFRIMGLSAGEFPAMPDVAEFAEYQMAQCELLQGLRETANAASTDETRYVLNGVLMSIEGNGVTLVATDGRRLSKTSQEIANDSSENRDIIIPTKAVNELMRSLGEEGKVIIRVGETYTVFAMENCLIMTKLIEGNYPNWRQVIPEKLAHKIGVNRKALIEGINRAALIATDGSQAVKLRFDEEITASVTTPDVGESREVVEVIMRSNTEPLEIGLNPQFTLSTLKGMVSTDVLIRLSGETSPLTIEDGHGFLAVIMPMRLG
jgi:DNA polymerase-3 subunit beta